MPGQRQDYILRQIELLRQFVSRLLADRNEATLDEALNLSFHLQAKLFPLPVPEFLQLDADGQIAALSQGESPVAARDKCTTYVALLSETAMLYDLRGRDDLARGARQLALHIALTTALATEPGIVRRETERLVRDLRTRLPGDELPPPLAERLRRYDDGAGSVTG